MLNWWAVFPVKCCTFNLSPHAGRLQAYCWPPSLCVSAQAWQAYLLRWILPSLSLSLYLWYLWLYDTCYDNGKDKIPLLMIYNDMYHWEKSPRPNSTGASQWLVLCLAELHTSWCQWPWQPGKSASIIIYSGQPPNATHPGQHGLSLTTVPSDSHDLYLKSHSATTMCGKSISKVPKFGNVAVQGHWCNEPGISTPSPAGMSQTCSPR